MGRNSTKSRSVIPPLTSVFGGLRQNSPVGANKSPDNESLSSYIRLMKLWKIKGDTHRSAPRSKQIVFNSPNNTKPKTKKDPGTNRSKKLLNRTMNRCCSVEDKENTDLMSNLPKCSASKVLFSDEIGKSKGAHGSKTHHGHANSTSINMKKKKDSENVKCQNSSEFLQFKTKKNL
jgi:hypothetical protein